LLIFCFFETNLACLDPDPLTLSNTDQQHRRIREINDELQAAISPSPPAASEKKVITYPLDCFACEIRELHETPTIFATPLEEIKQEYLKKGEGSLKNLYHP
jgi:hypothetical protein